MTDWLKREITSFRRFCVASVVSARTLAAGLQEITDGTKELTTEIIRVTRYFLDGLLALFSACFEAAFRERKGLAGLAPLVCP